jgi:hypothetical protein
VVQDNLSAKVLSLSLGWEANDKTLRQLRRQPTLYLLTASCSRRQNIGPDHHPTTTARLAGQIAHDGHADGLQEVLQVPATLPGVQTARNDALLFTTRHISQSHSQQQINLLFLRRTANTKVRQQVKQLITARTKCKGSAGTVRTIFLLATSKSCRIGFSRIVRATPFSMYSCRRDNIPNQQT